MGRSFPQAGAGCPPGRSCSPARSRCCHDPPQRHTRLSHLMHWPHQPTTWSGRRKGSGGQRSRRARQSPSVLPVADRPCGSSADSQASSRITDEHHPQSKAAPQPFANNYSVLFPSRRFDQPGGFCDGNKLHAGPPAIQRRRQQSRGLGTGGTWVLLLKLPAADGVAGLVWKRAFRVWVCTLLKAAGLRHRSGRCFWLPEDSANAAGHRCALCSEGRNSHPLPARQLRRDLSLRRKHPCCSTATNELLPSFMRPKGPVCKAAATHATM